MRRVDVLIAVLLVLLVVGSCSRRQEEGRASSGERATTAYRSFTAPPPTVPGRLPAAETPVLTRDRKLVRTVKLELEARDPEAAARQIESLAARLGGYVTSSMAQRDNDGMRCSVTLRVPAVHTDDALVAFRRLAVRVNLESQQVEDVTERVVDVDARLRTISATEKELLALLGESRTRQNKAADIMVIYGELTEIRSRIEQLQGQKQALEREVAFSTIHVGLAPEEVGRPVVQGGWQPGGMLHIALRMLVAGLRGLFAIAVIFVVVVLPVGFLAALPVWLAARLLKRARRKTT